MSPPVQGLRVGKGLICRNKLGTGGSCGIVMLSMDSMKTHWRRNRCMSDGIGSCEQSYIQSLFSGNRRSFFEVTNVDHVGEVFGSAQIKNLCDLACRDIDQDIECFTKLESAKMQTTSDS